MASPLDDNPFADPVLDYYRREPDNALDSYRQYFRAVLTARTSVGGVYQYDWKEQVIDPATGGSADANPRRSGGVTAGSPAFELNNKLIDLSTPVYVFMRQKGIVGNTMAFEFEYTPAVASSGGGDVWGPVSAYTGAVTLFTDPSGRFIGPADVMVASGFRNSGVNYRRFWIQSDPFAVSDFGRGFGGAERRPTHELMSYTGTAGFLSGTVTGFSASTAVCQLGYFQLSGNPSTAAGVDALGLVTYFNSTGNALGGFISFTVAGNTNSGRLEFYPAASGAHVVLSALNIDFWMPHFSSDGTAGITTSFTVKVGGVDKTASFKDGILVSVS